jgi:hypothetical protein
MHSGRPIDPVLEGINPEDLEQPIPESPWRKPLIFVLGIFLLLLIVSFSFSDTLSGLIQSKKVSQSALYFPESTVIFEGNTLELLQKEYVSNENREIKACLFGTKAGSSYIISRVEFPEIIRANVIHVVSVPCPVETLIDLHGHPINSCLASAQDVSVYDKLKQSNPVVRMMIMCSSTRFALI